ncbi:MAG: hypothetical protein K0R23_1656 [Lacrimispora sp.]|nr:hypothetical protein [Lacrimispora sp.]
MARGVRKSSLEKLQKELAEVQESIQQHKNSITELIEKEKEIQEKISLEQFKEVSSILECTLTKEDFVNYGSLAKADSRLSCLPLPLLGYFLMQNNNRNH